MNKDMHTPKYYISKIGSWLINLYPKAEEIQIFRYW